MVYTLQSLMLLSLAFADVRKGRGYAVRVGGAQGDVDKACRSGTRTVDGVWPGRTLLKDEAGVHTAFTQL